MNSGYVSANLKISEVVTFKIPASYNSFEIYIITPYTALKQICPLLKYE